MKCTQGPDTTNYKNECHNPARYAVTTEDSSVVRHACKKHLVAAVERFMDIFEGAAVLVERLS